MRNPEYRLLWLSDVVQCTGGNPGRAATTDSTSPPLCCTEYFTFLAVLIIMGSASESSITVSLFLLTRFLPPFLLSPIVGIVLDRYDRLTVLVTPLFRTPHTTTQPLVTNRTIWDCADIIQLCANVHHPVLPADTRARGHVLHLSRVDGAV